MNRQRRKLTRRQFVRNAAAGAAALTVLPRHVLGAPGQPAANDKLRIAGIGAGGQGGASLSGTSSENIVALCDVDTRRAAEAFKRFPQAKRYRDPAFLEQAIESIILTKRGILGYANAQIATEALMVRLAF